MSPNNNTLLSFTHRSQVRVPERNVIDNLCYHVRDGNGVVFHLINKFMLYFDLVWKENGNTEVMACPRLLLCSIIISKVTFIDVILIACAEYEIS